MKNQIEIERRFLLKNVPIVKYDEFMYIEQIYNLSSPVIDRLRKVATVREDEVHEDGEAVVGEVGTHYIHTTKESILGMEFGMKEIEKEVETDVYWDYLDMLDEGKASGIRKIRHIKEEGNLKWEIDFFQTCELVIAEIEIPTEDYDLKIPEYIKDNLIMEITGMKEFSNYNLADKK